MDPITGLNDVGFCVNKHEEEMFRYGEDRVDPNILNSEEERDKIRLIVRMSHNEWLTEWTETWSFPSVPSSFIFPTLFR